MIMREIKFRGKFSSFNQFVPHPDEGKWVYGDLVHDAMLFLGEYHDCIYTDGENGRSMTHVDPNTIGQYTGFTDKNGVKIYEGDIIRYTDNSNEDYPQYNKVCDVTFEAGCFYPVSEYWVKDVEVIGNIYDNSELLKTDSND